MKWNQLFSSVLSCAVLIGTISSVSAANLPSNTAISLDEMNRSAVVLSLADNADIAPRASGTINMAVQPRKMAVSSSTFSLDSGETVTIKCSYTPTNAAVDVGLVSANGTFYYVSSSSGSINKTIEITQRGQYSLGIRNNSSNAIQVTGSIRY